MVELLNARYAEALICRDNDAHFAAIVTMGSLLEGALLQVLTERDPKFRAQVRDRKEKGEPEQKYSLSNLIDMAHKRNYIARDARDFTQVLRDYRNFVHPRVQLDFAVTPDADLVDGCWYAAIMALRDLDATLS